MTILKVAIPSGKEELGNSAYTSALCLFIILSIYYPDARFNKVGNLKES